MIQRTVAVVPPPKRGVNRYARWVARACSPGDRVLNIGAGSGLSGALKPVLRQRPYLVGIDPHLSIHANATLDERHQQSLEQFAATDPKPFDVALSVYVLEHVEEPEAFVSAAARVLRPGGSLFGLTLNMYQYFGFATWAATRVGLSEWLLRRVKEEELVRQYHFTTQYRLNSISCITRHLAAAGFASVEFRCFDETARYAWYLPLRTRGFATAYTKMAYAIGSPWIMGHLSFRATRSEDG